MTSSEAIGVNTILMTDLQLLKKKKNKCACIMLDFPSLARASDTIFKLHWNSIKTLCSRAEHRANFA